MEFDKAVSAYARRAGLGGDLVYGLRMLHPGVLSCLFRDLLGGEPEPHPLMMAPHPKDAFLERFSSEQARAIVVGAEAERDRRRALANTLDLYLSCEEAEESARIVGDSLRRYELAERRFRAA